MKITWKEIAREHKQKKLSVRAGQKYRIQGDSKDFWIEDYNCRVNTIATVEEDITNNRQKKILVTLEEIDHDKNVCVTINIDRMLGL